MECKLPLRVSINVYRDVWDAETGEHLRRDTSHNMVVTSGLNLIRDLLIGGLGAMPINEFAIGTGTNLPAAGNTALQTEVLRVAFTKVESSSGKATFKVYIGSSTGNGNTFSEAALFAGGVLFARVIFTPDLKTSAQAWTFVWEVTISDDGV